MRVRIKETPQDVDINTTIKPIEREESNAELEKGEIVFDPNKLTLHKVLGKRHSAGGTPVNLDSGSFIFSDYKKLAINKKNADLMEFKKGGTPAKVLAKEVNIKHHNSMVDMISNQKGDEISHNAAQLMIEKNLEKTGQVAYLQEEKKRFPQGRPEFSQGTAPVYSAEINMQLAKAEQYQKGGHFLPKFQLGAMATLPFMNADFECPCGRDPVTRLCIPCPDGDPRLGKLNAPLVSEAPKGYNPVGSLNNSNYYSNTAFGATSKGSPDFNKAFAAARDGSTFMWNGKPYKKEYAKPGISDRFVRTESSALPQRNMQPEERMAPTRATPTTTVTGRTQGPQQVPTSNPDLPVIAKYPKIGLTDYQKLDLGRQAIAALSIKRYDPIRQQQESVITQPELFSAQPYLNQINQGYFNAAASLRTLTNPSQLTAANRELYGNRLDQSDKAIGNIENQNVSLLNASKQNNANILNSDAVANRGFDQKYYNDTILSRQNYDNLKDIATDNLFNGFNETMGEVQTMQNMINSQRPIKTDVPIKDKNGKTIGWEGQLPVLPQKGFFGYTTRYNPNISGEGILNYNTGAAGNSYASQQQLLSELQNLKAQIDSTVDERAKAAMIKSYWDIQSRLAGLNTSNRR